LEIKVDLISGGKTGP